MLTGTLDFSAPRMRAFAAACGFEPTPGRCRILPDAKGKIAGVLFGIESADACVRDLFLPGQLATSLPCGVYRFANRPHDEAEIYETRRLDGSAADAASSGSGSMSLAGVLMR